MRLGFLPIFKEFTILIESFGIRKQKYFPGGNKILSSYSKTNQMHQFLKFFLFCSSPIHVSDGLSVHHQESKTVHTASYHTGSLAAF